MKNLQIIRLDQARKLALLSQALPVHKFKRGLTGTLAAIRHLGYVQIDTISVVERAHHHCLWNRVPHYKHRFLDQLIEQRTIFEYWSHAAAYLPIEDYRYCLPRMLAIKTGQRHWYQQNKKLMRYVLNRIKSEGALQAKDFAEHENPNAGMWQWSPIKQAIESLFMQGDLLVTRRINFQKVFDLTERVLPSDVNTQAPTPLEYAHFLIDRHIQAHGIAHFSEFGYLRKGMSKALKLALTEQVEANILQPIRIHSLDGIYYAAADVSETLKSRLALNKLRLLSPFDNLVIQRKRLLRLFEFNYQLECYVPEKKRVYGYFVLPILWRGQLVGRIDCKAERKTKTFFIKNLWLEKKSTADDEFYDKLGKELQQFAEFCGCQQLQTSPDVAKQHINFRNL